jgi:hypothetical protein
LHGGWIRYTNDRFGTQVEIPRSFKAVEPKPANGDGREFESKDGARLWVYGSFGPYVVTENFEDYKRWLIRDENKDGIRNTYIAEGKGWLVYSGIRGATISYTKVIEGCGEIEHHMSIEYPAARKQTYDPVVARMSRSLRCGPGIETTPLAPTVIEKDEDGTGWVRILRDRPKT